MNIVETIKTIHTQSKRLWQSAIDTADEEGDWVDLAETCDEAYLEAIKAIESRCDDWQHEARRCLETAKSCESDGGDSAHATEALQRLEEYLQVEVRP